MFFSTGALSFFRFFLIEPEFMMEEPRTIPPFNLRLTVPLTMTCSEVRKEPHKRHFSVEPRLTQRSFAAWCRPFAKALPFDPRVYSVFVCALFRWKIGIVPNLTGAADCTRTSRDLFSPRAHPPPALHVLHLCVHAFARSVAPPHRSDNSAPPPFEETFYSSMYRLFLPLPTNVSKQFPYNPLSS